jgi:hypothetical protein
MRLPRLEAYAVVGACQPGKAVRALQPLPSGTPVFPRTDSRTPWPAHTTLHLGAHTHLRPGGHLWRSLHHTCAPNCHLDFRTSTLVTTRALQGHTEWAMVGSFRPCACDVP